MSIQEEIVKEFEEKYNATVYHVVKNSTQFGVLLSFFLGDCKSNVRNG